MLSQLVNQETEGQGLAEYALLLVFISVVAVGTLELIGVAVVDVFMNRVPEAFQLQ